MLFQKQDLKRNNAEVAESCTAGFSYGIRHAYIVIHSSLNHKREFLQTGIRILHSSFDL